VKTNKGVRKFKEIHVVSNTHWDREFRTSFQRTRLQLVKMLDALLDLLEQDPDYASYTLDAHSILVEDYLEIRPENRERLAQLARMGRLWIGPWYTLPDIPNVGQEAVVRNLVYGHKVAWDLDAPVMKVGYTPCSWGQTGQLPQIYSGFDIHDILFYRGISPHESPAEFIWESPDGTRALAHRFALFARYNYYYLVFRKITYGLDYNDRQWVWGRDGETPFRLAEDGPVGIELLEPKVRYLRRRLRRAIEEMLELEGGQYQYPYFLAMHGHDISWPHPKESKTIQDAGKDLKGIRVIHSDLGRYFASLRKATCEDDMTVLKGERRSSLKEGFWTYLLPATISARTYLKKMNFLTEAALVAQAEPFAVMNWMDAGAYPERYLDLAWRYLLGNHTHDANAGCASDNVTADVEYRYRQSGDLSEGVTQECLKELVCRIDTREAKPEDHFLSVFNPLPHERNRVLPITIDLPEETGARSLEIRNSEGRIVDWQLSDCSPEGLFVDNKWNVPQTFLSTRFRILLDAKPLPAMGYETFQIIPRQKPDRRSGSLIPSANTLENEFIRVEIAGNGTLDLVDKERGVEYWGLGYLQDQGEVGNAWRHEPPSQDRVLNSLGVSAQVAVVEEGSLAATLRVDFTVRVPQEAAGESARSQSEVDLPVTHFVRLTRGAPRVEVTTEFDNRAKDHWLRLMLPSGVNTKVSHADSHFDVVERRIALPNTDDWKEPAVGTYPFRTFVDLSDGKCGLAFLGEGLQEFEVFDDEDRMLAISLVRAVRIKLEVSENRKQELPDVGSQCPGPQRFRWALYPHGGGWAEGRCAQQALDFLTPVRAAQFGKNESGLQARRRSLVELDSQAIVLAAIKRCEERDTLVARLYNPTPSQARGILRFQRPVKHAWRTNLNEEQIALIRGVKGREVPLRLGRKKIETVEVEFLA